MKFCSLIWIFIDFKYLTRKNHSVLNQVTFVSQPISPRQEIKLPGNNSLKISIDDSSCMPFRFHMHKFIIFKLYSIYFWIIIIKNYSFFHDFNVRPLWTCLKNKCVPNSWLFWKGHFIMLKTILFINRSSVWVENMYYNFFEIYFFYSKIMLFC